MSAHFAFGIITVKAKFIETLEKFTEGKILLILLLSGRSIKVLAEQSKAHEQDSQL